MYYDNQHTVPSCPEDLSKLVLSSGSACIWHILPSANGTRILFQPDPLDLVRCNVYWTRQLSFIPWRCPAHVWAAQYTHLCRHHERTQSRHLATARHAAYLKYTAQRASAGHHLLPGACKYRCSRGHVLNAHATVDWAHQHSPRIHRAAAAGLAGEPIPRPILSGAG